MKDVKKNLGSLFRFMKPWRLWFIIILIFAVGSSVMVLLGPRLMQRITDYILIGITNMFNPEIGYFNTYQSIVTVGIWLAVIYGTMFVLGYVQEFMASTVTQKIVRKLRLNMSQKINRLPLKYFDSQPFGDTLSRITNDADQISMSLTYSTTATIQAGILIIGSAAFMFATNWLMALTAVGSTLVAFAVMSVIVSKTQVYFERQRVELGEVNGHIEEYFTGHTVVKVNNAEKKTLAEFNKLNGKLFTSDWKSQFYGGLLLPLMMFIQQFSFVTVCVVGGVLVFNGSITFGVIVSFMLYVRLFTQPLSDLAQVAFDVQATSAASRRVFGFLQEEDMPDESGLTTSVTSIKGDIKFDNVKFGYDPEVPIIHNFSADVKSGSKVAIVGPTGAGKTTMVNLLMKFYNVDGGEIKIDGVPISKMRRGDVSGLFSMVLQDAWLFEGTIRENLIYNMKIDKAKERGILDAACEAAGLGHFIRTLPDGYDTVLDERASVSDGQKQLLTIARAMIKNAPLLILDEATSSVDTRTEVLVKRAMDKLAAGRTSFIIAHRLSTIRDADLILVMKDGDVVEKGTHDELLKANGFYAELYTAGMAG